MFGGSMNEIGSCGHSLAMTGSRAGQGACADANTNWQAVDRALRGIAKRKASMDAEEAYWLREAEACQLWKQLGMVSALDYMERVFGYGPRAAQERLRVARAIGGLPKLAGALARGALSFSAVRELSRIATPATEAAWLDEALGKTQRQLEELVAVHNLGDLPHDPPDPKVRPHVVRFELSAETFALTRQARQVLDDEHGRHLTDDECIAAMCHAVLDGPARAVGSPDGITPSDAACENGVARGGAGRASSGRAKYQIAITLCERCGQGWQEGGGARVPIGPAIVDRALCDAQHVGSIDAPAPQRAYQDIPPSVARLVWQRDHGRCRVPVAGPRAGSRSITSSIAPTVVATTRATSSSPARRAIRRTTPAQ